VRRLLKRLILYAFQILFARPIMVGVVGVRYRRRNAVPEGPCLVVSNHNSHLDAAVLMTMFPLRRVSRVHPVAAADYFGSSWFMRMWAMLFLNSVPFERKPSRGKDALAPLIDLLKSGDSLIFFPEGSRGEAGVVARFRPGIGMLVKALPGLLVVPVYLSGPERIWPRGNVVPVPLSIDANIGKPRTYDPDLDPREIADRVRADVLALAPPAPPVPGVRPQPPVRVAVCGIDDESRKELHLRVTERLGGMGRTLGVSDPVLEADADGIRESQGPIAAGPRRWLRLLAGVFRTGHRYKGSHFVELLERARVDEALEHGRDTRFVVVDGSAFVDLMAWTGAGLHRGAFDERQLNRLAQYVAGEKSIPFRAWWRFVRNAPEVWLINVLGLARPPCPDVLVHLRFPMSRLMERLRSRGEELLPYQNEAFLERLQDAYGQVGAVLRKRRKVEVLELDVSDASAADAAARVMEACRRSETEGKFARGT
jgi:1-acyl-sn-glycerol-3-phosphate acyltransferase